MNTTYPTITKTTGDIRAAIYAYDERYQRVTARNVFFGLALADAGEAVIAIRSKTKIKALEHIAKLISDDAASAPLYAHTALIRWRTHRKRVAQHHASGQIARDVAAAQMIEANAYIMTFSWALGVFDRIGRKIP